MKNLFYRLSFSGIALLFASAGLLQADVLVLQNGDRLQGQLIEQKDGRVFFETPQLGLLNLDAASVTVEAAEAEAPPAPAAEATEASSEAVAETPTDFQWWEFWRYQTPENWEGEFSLGFSKENASNTTTDFNLGTSLKWQRTELDRFVWKAYYNYEATNNQKDTDEWGISQDYRYDFAERWFVRSFTANETDQISDTRWDIEQIVGIGYRVIDREDMTLNVVPGVGLRYVDQPSPGDGTFWNAEFFQDFEWKVAERLILFEDFTLTGNLEDSDNYQWVTNIGAESPLTERLSLRLVYTYDYDNFVDTTETELTGSAVLKF